MIYRTYLKGMLFTFKIRINQERMNFSVLQLDKATNKIIAEYPSLREASNKTGIASSTICNVCNGKGKTAGGFKWKYKNNN
jgi:hypothetical protein